MGAGHQTVELKHHTLRESLAEEFPKTVALCGGKSERELPLPDAYAGVPAAIRAKVEALEAMLAGDFPTYGAAAMREPLMLARFVLARPTLEEAADMWRKTHAWRALHVPRALEECGAFGDPSHGPCDGAPARGRWTWRRHADPASPGAPGRTLRGSMANTYGTATLLRRGGETVVAGDGDPVAVSQMGRMDLAGIVREHALDVLQMYQVSFLEDCLQEARARSAREGRLVRCHTLIDLDGLSVLVAARCIRKILPPIAKVAQQYYPEVNSSNTAINAPMGVESLWRIVQLFIDENMRQKVRIVGRSYRGALVDHAKIADLAKLARRHGGDVPDAELLPACPPIPQGFRELVDADPTPPFLQDIIS